MPSSLRSASLSFLVFSAAIAPAQSPVSAAVPWPSDRVLVDAPGDGSVWAAASTWKAGFDAHGATFHPFLGGDRAGAAATFALGRARAGAVELTVAAAAPQASAAGIAYERGAVREQYVLGPAGIEQQFVLPWLPNRDELRLDVAVTTSLRHRADDAGHAFVGANGGVHYGAAVAIDARGRRQSLTTTWQDGALQIVVPGDFLAAAVLPLTVDPLIAAIVDATAPSSAELSSTDLGFDRTRGEYYLAYERAYSVADHDVFVVRLDAAMQPLGLVTIDITSASWTRPRLAVLEANDLVGVTANVRPAGGAHLEVWLRTFTGVALPGAALQVAAHPLYDRCDPDLGGDENLQGPASFLIAYEKFDGSINDSDIAYRLVTSAGAPGPEGSLYAGIGFEQRVAISKSCGSIGGGTEGWALVYCETDYQQTAGQLLVSFVTRQGALRDPVGPTLFGVLTAPTENLGKEWDVSSPTTHDQGRTFLCVERVLEPVSGRGQVLGHAFDAFGNAVAPVAVLATPSIDRRNPVVDSDGTRFAVACATVYSATDADVRATTVALVAGALTTQDVGVVSFSADLDDQPALCAANGTQNRHGLAWTHRSAGTWSQQCQLYRSAGAGGVTTRATACGGLGINWSGALALGETLQLALPNATGIGGFLVGGPVSVPIPGCQGCVVGADGIAWIGATLAIAVPANPALVGAVLAAQGVRYDPALGPCLGALAFSNTLDVVVQ